MGYPLISLSITAVLCKIFVNRIHSFIYIRVRRPHPTSHLNAVFSENGAWFWRRVLMNRKHSADKNIPGNPRHLRSRHRRRYRQTKDVNPRHLGRCHRRCTQQTKDIPTQIKERTERGQGGWSYRHGIARSTQVFERVVVVVTVVVTLVVVLSLGRSFVAVSFNTWAQSLWLLVFFRWTFVLFSRLSSRVILSWVLTIDGYFGFFESLDFFMRGKTPELVCS